MAKVTVIIPSYNAEQHIERCLLSFEKQDYRDFDILIIDDASTDKTVEKIHEVAEKLSFPVSVLQQAVNAGPAAARNHGIKHASSEYICFCDSDDWYDSNYLSVMMDRIQNDCSDVAFCGYKVVSPEGKEEFRPLPSDQIISESAAALKLDVDSLCVMIVKRQLIQQIEIPNLRNGEDMAVIPLLIVKANQCSVVEACLYNYFRNNNSASQSATMNSVHSLERSFEHVCKHFPEQADVALEYIGVRNLLYSALITLFSIAYNTKEANRILETFEECFPAWYKNPHICDMPGYKRMVLKMVHHRWYLALYAVAMVRKILTGSR